MCNLKKSYGLKQSLRAWFDRFTKAVNRYEYSQGQTNHILSVKHSPKGKIVILIVNVDGIIPSGDYEEEISKLTGFVAKEFKIKDLGNLKYFLNREVA